MEFKNDSKSCAARRAGSIPALGTNLTGSELRVVHDKWTALFIGYVH